MHLVEVVRGDPQPKGKLDPFDGHVEGERSEDLPLFVFRFGDDAHRFNPQGWVA